MKAPSGEGALLCLGKRNLLHVLPTVHKSSVRANTVRPYRYDAAQGCSFIAAITSSPSRSPVSSKPKDWYSALATVFSSS